MKRLATLIALLWLAGGAAFAEVSEHGSLGHAGPGAASDTASHKVRLRVTQVCELDLNDRGSISLATGATHHGPAGNGAPGTTNATKRLWYTAINGAGLTSKITVQSSVRAPAGTRLQVAATVEAGAGVAAGGPLTISTTAADLVTHISNVITGRTRADGARLEYTFSIADSSLLDRAGDVTATIIYTLTGDGAAP